MVSWRTRLEQAKAKTAAGAVDPWRLPLERLHGKDIGDGIERIATQAVFDFLEVPQVNRRAGACKRLARVLKDLGWNPIKARGLNQAGFRDQIRGYAKDKWGSPLS